MQTSFQPKERWRALEVYRVVGILTVLFHHYQADALPAFLRMTNAASWVMIDVFFVQSGFLIANQLLSSTKADGRVDLAGFWWRRAARILPIYYLILAVNLLMEYRSTVPSMAPAWRYFAFVQNWGDMDGRFLISWSVCVEEHFYLLFPLIVAGLLRIGAGARTIIATAVLLLLSQPLLRGLLWETHLAGRDLGSDDAQILFHNAIYVKSFVRLDGIAWGVLLAAARLYLPGLTTWINGKGNKLVLGVVLTAAVALPLFADRFSLATVTWGMSLSPLLCLILTAAGLDQSSVLAKQTWRPAALVASVSYALYLSHGLTLTFWQAGLRRLGLDFPVAVGFPLYFALATAVGWGLKRLVEEPARQVILTGFRAPALSPRRHATSAR